MRSLFIILAIALGSFAANGQELSQKSKRQLEEAQIYYKKGLYEDAISLVKMTLLTNTKQTDLHIFAAQCYLKLDDPVRAERHLRKAARIGSYKADQMLDSLRGRMKSPIDETFKDDLEEYLQETATPSDQ